MAVRRYSRSRNKPDDILWPVTESTVEAINNNFDVLFKDLRTVADDVLPPYLGGTGLSEYEIGDLIVATDRYTLDRLASGAVGQVLRGRGLLAVPEWGKVSVVDPNSHLTGLTTKGDLIAYGASGYQRLAAGANGLVLTADNTVAAGLKWAPAGAAIGDSFLLMGG